MGKQVLLGNDLEAKKEGKQLSTERKGNKEVGWLQWKINGTTRYLPNLPNLPCLPGTTRYNIIYLTYLFILGYIKYTIVVAVVEFNGI